MYTDKRRYGQDPTVVVRSKTTFNDPLKWMEHRTIFTCSWSDFFHDVADAWRPEAWDIIRRTPQHTYLILTKRPERMRGRLPWTDHPWPHVWLGVSPENQKYADERIPILLGTPAAHRFLSVEPLLGPIDLQPWLDQLDWVILGGESGPDFRPMEIKWATVIVEACAARGVPVFMKQDSARDPEQQGRLPGEIWKHKVVPDDIPDDQIADVVVESEADRAASCGIGVQGGQRAHNPEPDVTHEAVPGGEHFACTCGAWYSSERGRKTHLSRVVTWQTVEEFQALVTRAGFTLKPSEG
jgi:protein gp37